MTGQEEGLLRLIHCLAEEKKAQNMVMLDIGKVSLVADYFLIATGNSKIQVQSIADHIMEGLKDQGHSILHREGYNESTWVLLDYGSVIVHLFQPEERIFYNLERLWGHAPRIDADEEPCNGLT